MVWDDVAKDYGKHSLYWNEFGKRLIEFISPQVGAKILDIATGRGATLFPMHSLVGKDAEITCIDSSTRMIEELKKDIQRNQMSNVLCLNDDIYSRNFEAEFDYVISGFFLVSFLYREDQLRRVWRFLKEGGCLGFSSWGRQTDQIWLTKIVEKYIGTNEEDSVKLYNSRESIKEAVISSGFVNVEIIEETSIVQYSNKEHWWNEMQSNAFKNVIATIENKGIEVLKEFVEEVNEGLEAFNHEESYRFKMPVIYCKAKKVTSKLL